MWNVKGMHFLGAKSGDLGDYWVPQIPLLRRISFDKCCCCRRKSIALHRIFPISCPESDISPTAPLCLHPSLLFARIFLRANVNCNPGLWCMSEERRNNHICYCGVIGEALQLYKIRKSRVILSNKYSRTRKCEQR